MATIRVGINGFGRIGRNVLRACLGESKLEFVAVNDLTDAEDAGAPPQVRLGPRHAQGSDVQGRRRTRSSSTARRSRCSAERDPGEAPLEGPRRRPRARVHRALHRARQGGEAPRRRARRRSSSPRPPKDADVTSACGVNHRRYDPAKHHVISNASCTTNCLAPVAKVLHDTFGIKRGLMTTIHSYTNDQRILDLPHEDLRRARAAALSMIPTRPAPPRRSASSSRSSRASSTAWPSACRRRTSRSSTSPSSSRSRRPRRTINAAMKAAADGPLKGILEYSEEPLVSSDFIGTPTRRSSTARSRASSTRTSCKVFSWYDNEWGFSNRMLDVSRARRAEPP